MNTHKLRRPVKLKDGRTFAVGDAFNVLFIQTPSGSPRMEVTRLSDGAHATLGRFDAFFAPPSMNELAEYVSDGVCETVTGDRTEPDGYGPDGAPSWLLALGMI